MNISQNMVVIRADSGVGVGAGHLMRMLALANGCRKLGLEITFAVNDIPGSIARKISKSGCELVSITSERGSQEDATETLELSTDRNAKWLVLDGYCFDDDYQQRVKPKNTLIMVVDDFGHGSHYQADMILNQNAYADVSRYQQLMDTKSLCGIRYTLLKPEFQEQSKPVGVRNSVRAQARNILVTMGGCDQENYTLPVIQALEEIHACRKADLHVDCVIGPDYDHEIVLREFEKSSQMRFRIHRNVDRMDLLMRETDLAITAGGSTCYELARLGVPAIAIATADNQVPVVRELAKRNTLCHFQASRVQLGMPTGPTPAFVLPQPDLSKFVKSLIDDSSQRTLMSKAGKDLIDGLGANRVGRALYSELLEFRNVLLDDSKTLLRWRNDPEVRSVSFHQTLIQQDEHQTWLEKSLAMPERILLMVEDHDKNAIGRIQIDFTDQSRHTAMIGIVLGLEYRARGLGTILIEKATSALFTAESKVQQIIAQVKHGNLASERAFRKAGFVTSQATTVNQHLAHQLILHRFYRSFGAPKASIDASNSVSRAA